MLFWLKWSGRNPEITLLLCSQVLNPKKKGKKKKKYLNSGTVSQQLYFDNNQAGYFLKIYHSFDRKQEKYEKTRRSKNLSSPWKCSVLCLKFKVLFILGNFGLLTKNLNITINYFVLCSSLLLCQNDAGCAATTENTDITCWSRFWQSVW